MNSIQPVASLPAVSGGMYPLAEVVLYAPLPAPCRCGRYFSEDFDGRLFCRGCEGTDAADITSRLPLCLWSR
jgi:hypothetical protein